MSTRLLTLALLCLALGCGGPSHPPSHSQIPDSPSSAKPGFPLAVTDDLNRQVTVARRPERIISLSPALTETLFAVGAGPRVVAVTTTDTYPVEVKKLPTVGGFSPETISLEAILAQKPDLILAGGRFQEPVVQSLAKIGLTALVIDPRTLQEVEESITLVGRLTGQNSEATTLVGDFRARLEAVRKRGSAISPEERPRVLYVLWDQPLQTAGPATFIGQMIAAAGGTNLAPASPPGYPVLSDEAVLAGDPDLILAPDHGLAGMPERLKKRPGWGRLKAVQKERIVKLPEDLLNRPGPRLIEGLEALEAVLRKGR